MRRSDQFDQPVQCIEEQGFALVVSLLRDIARTEDALVARDVPMIVGEFSLRRQIDVLEQWNRLIERLPLEQENAEI